APGRHEHGAAGNDARLPPHHRQLQAVLSSGLNLLGKENPCETRSSKCHRSGRFRLECGLGAIPLGADTLHPALPGRRIDPTRSPRVRRPEFDAGGAGFAGEEAAAGLAQGLRRRRRSGGMNEMNSLALLAPARRATAALRDVLKRWNTARKEAAEDRQTWKLALTDARVMADISRDNSIVSHRSSRGSLDITA